MDSSDLHRRRAYRAQERRRRRLRRRIAAVTGLVVVVAAAAAVALASTGGSSSPASAASRDRSAARQTGHGTTGRTHPKAVAATRHHATGGSTAAALGPAAGHPGTASVPVLMYHVIAPPPAGAPYPGLYVTPQEFTAQMEALKQAGWAAVTLDQLRAYWSDGARLPA